MNCSLEKLKIDDLSDVDKIFKGKNNTVLTTNKKGTIGYYEIDQDQNLVLLE